MLYLNLCVSLKAVSFSDLTLTNVVFELTLAARADSVISNLTLTNVVFECRGREIGGAFGYI